MPDPSTLLWDAVNANAPAAQPGFDFNAKKAG
jgi:hypothetical protein